MRVAGKLLLLAIIIGVIVVGWTMLGNQPVKSANRLQAGIIIKDQKKIYENLEVVAPSDYVDDYNDLRVFGSIKNISPSICKYAKLKIKVSDEIGKVLKTLDVTVKNVKAGETKSYDIDGGTGLTGVKVEADVTEAGFATR